VRVRGAKRALLHRVAERVERFTRTAVAWPIGRIFSRIMTEYRRRATELMGIEQLDASLAVEAVVRAGARTQTAGSAKPTSTVRPAPASIPELVIEAGRGDRQYWLDLWRYRELFNVLAWRDISVRYKQTVIGAAWALIRPLLTMVVFTIVFGKIAQFPSDGVPYALIVFAGMLPWTLFSTALVDASNSLLSNANLISKVYFPRLIIPSAAVMVSLIDFLISFAILVVLLVWYQYVPSWSILLLPAFIALAFAISLGPALWITALNVRYRDFRYVIPFIIQIGLYVSPVGFSSKVIPEQWKLLYYCNPIVGVIDGFRWSILGGTNHIYLPGFLMSIGTTGVLLWFGVRQFRRAENTFADLI
jgi:lipopolysaccharide transport system permease protein